MYRWLGPILFVSLIVFANWPWTYKELHVETIGNGVVFGNFTSNPMSMVLAGWPCRFYQSVGLVGEESIETFSWASLAADTLTWTLLAAAIWYYRNSRKQPSAKQDDETGFETSEKVVATNPASSRRKDGNLKLSDLFILTAIVAIVFGYWKLLQSRSAADKVIADEIALSGGSVTLISRLPSWTQNFTSLHETFRRINEVRLLNPDNEVVKQIVELPYLTTLNVCGGSYDLNALQFLSQNPMLVDLAIVGREIDSSLVEAIRKIRSLKMLNLMRTNITSEGVQAIEQPNLRVLNLIHTDVRLANLGKPRFANSLRTLLLPRPPVGEGDSLVIEGWPELEEIGCFEYDEKLNDETVTVILVNLPELELLKLDSLQLFDLELDRLPQLKSLEQVNNQWDERTTAKQVVPSWPWIRRLKIQSVPKLASLSIFAADTELIDISSDGPRELGLSVYDKNHERNPDIFQSARGFAEAAQATGFMPPGYLDSRRVPKETRQKWIDDIGRCRGVETLDLAFVPLDGLDLSPLVHAASIKKLDLSESALNPKQLEQLKGMVQLQSLSLEGLSVDGRQIEWLTKTFPDLKTLVCDRQVQRLRLEHLPNLESIFEKPKKQTASDGISIGRFSNNPLDALKIVDAAKLRDKFEAVDPMKLLHIDSAPSLRGLSFHSPLPKNSVLRGLRDLAFFAAGGESCNDEIVSEVLKCTSLKSLTLAYSSATPATLSKIDQLTDLEYLVLTGSAADDQLLAGLSGLSKLKTLRLDHTQISDASASLVSRFSKLEYLDLGDRKLNAAGVSRLIELKGLRALNLAGCEVTSEHLTVISELGHLEILDLSKTELSSEQLGALGRNPPPSLRLIKLNQSKVDPVGFTNLVRALPREIRFSLLDTDIKSELMDWLVNQDRVLEYSSDGNGMAIRISNGRIIRGSIGTNTQVIFNRSELDNSGDSEGKIDPSLFAPIKPATEFNDLERTVESGRDFNPGELDASRPRPDSAVPMNLMRWLGGALYELGN